MGRRALHFGAGNIGRGFIGKILAEAEYDVIFADVVPILIDNLSTRKSYSVNIVGEACRVEHTRIAGAVYSNKDEIFDELIKADLLTTAVGPRILERLAPSIARGITIRREKGIDEPMNIICCENAIRATSTLKGFVIKELSPDMVEWMNRHVGFVDCAVDRIVPPARHEDPLEVTVEEFSEWVVDKTQFIGNLPQIKDVKFTDNLNAFIERKLMTVNTGHAVCAYLGQLYGHSDVRSSITDPRVRKVVEGAMRESGQVLIRRYGLDAAEQESYIHRIIKRFENPYIDDDVLRVGREPIRKLSPNDRLIKPLVGCMEYSLPSDNLIKGVAAALLYQNPDDPQAVQLQQMVKDKGPAGALAEISGINTEAAHNKASVDRVTSAMVELGTVVNV